MTAPAIAASRLSKHFRVPVPAEALTGRLTPLTLLGAAGLTTFLLFLARGVWKLGLRNYVGASA